jgi:cell division septation protein DedD
MSDTPIRRTNWSANPQTGRNDDPLAELERIVGRGRAPAPAPPSKPVSASQNTNEVPGNDFLGFSEDEFEAAFRSLEQTPSPSVREGAIFKKEPAFQQAPPQADYSRNFAQTFEEEMSGDKPFEPQPEFEQEFETRADAFDFDKRAIGAAQTNYRDKYESQADTEDAEPAYYSETRPRSGFVTVIAVTGLVFVAVIGALVYSWVGAKSTGEPITIAADKSPVKKMAAADTEQPASNKLIYDRLGSADDDTNNEKVVSREEQPVDNLNVPSTATMEEPTAAEGNSTMPRIILPNPSSQNTGTMNAPREVATTTVRVRPDGTMENIPANSATSASAPQAGSPTMVKPNIVTAPPSVKAAVPAVTAPVPEETASAEAATSAPEPAPVRTPAPSKTATKQLRMANAAPNTVSSSGSGFVVQISSQKSQESARASFTGMQSRFPQVLSGYQPSIKPVTLGNKGTFYRVRVGPMASRDEASALCGKLKAAGGDCVVTPN